MIINLLLRGGVFLCVFIICIFFSNLQYNFEGNYDIVRFFKEIQNAGMHAILRIGPYICGEWNYGYISHILFLYYRHVAMAYTYICFPCFNSLSPYAVAEAFLHGCVTSPECSSGCTMTPLR